MFTQNRNRFFRLSRRAHNVGCLKSHVVNLISRLQSICAVCLLLQCKFRNNNVFLNFSSKSTYTGWQKGTIYRTTFMCYNSWVWRLQNGSVIKLEKIKVFGGKAFNRHILVRSVLACVWILLEHVSTKGMPSHEISFRRPNHLSFVWAKGSAQLQ